VEYFADIFSELALDEKEVLRSHLAKLLKATVSKIDSYRWLFETGKLFKV